LRGEIAQGKGGGRAIDALPEKETPGEIPPPRRSLAKKGAVRGAAEKGRHLASPLTKGEGEDLEKGSQGLEKSRGRTGGEEGERSSEFRLLNRTSLIAGRDAFLLSLRETAGGRLGSFFGEGK